MLYKLKWSNNYFLLYMGDYLNLINYRPVRPYGAHYYFEQYVVRYIPDNFMIMPFRDCRHISIFNYFNKYDKKQ